MTDLVQIQCAVDSVEEADRIARALVEQRHAACVQRLPIHSSYVWERVLCQEAEHLLLIKTTRAAAEEAIAAIRALHSYEVAEIIMLPILGGAADYMAWVAQSVGPASQEA